MNATDAYPSVRGLIHDTANRFMRLHGGEWDELLSIAHESFLTATREFDPDHPKHAKYSTHVRNRVWWGLQHDLYRRIRDGRNRTCDTSELDHFPSRESFDLPAWMEDLSREARLAVRMVLDGHIHTMLQERAAKQQAPSLRKELRKWLRESGWSKVKIARVFREIGEALQ